MIDMNRQNRHIGTLSERMCEDRRIQPTAKRDYVPGRSARFVFKFFEVFRENCGVEAHASLN